VAIHSIVALLIMPSGNLWSGWKALSKPMLSFPPHKGGGESCAGGHQKKRTAFDLPIAIGTLAASEQFEIQRSLPTM